MSEKEKNDITGQSDTLQVGYAVALTLPEGVAPLRCYVGQIEVIDDLGLRMTLMDWVVGTFTSDDLFVPWSNIESCLVCKENHDLELFLEHSAPKWQAHMNGKQECSQE